MAGLLVWFCVVPPALVLLYFSVEVVLGLRPVGTAGTLAPTNRVVVIIPAHNEASMLGDTVQTLRERIRAATQILVVADNCSDQTAEIARAAGATVIERNDASRRGKGFALAFARDFLRSDPPDAVFVLDADCWIDRGHVEVICSQAVAYGEPVQSINLVSAPPDASPLVRLSSFAMLIKNLVRARGLYRLGGGITLFGTGMAFPWTVFSKVELATPETVEDLRLALLLARQGIRVHLDEGVQVTSGAAELEDSLDQRRRWEHGFLSNSVKHGLSTLNAGIRRRSRHLLALGLHMLVPPLALLFLAAAVALIPALTWAATSENFWPAILLLAALCMATASTGTAWHKEGRLVLGASALARAPLYVLWKIPLYLRFFWRRQTDWNRTRRFNERN